MRASARKSDTGTLSNDDRKATKQLAMMPRLMSGSVMRRNEYQRLAPRLSEQVDQHRIELLDGGADHSDDERNADDGMTENQRRESTAECPAY